MYPDAIAAMNHFWDTRTSTPTTSPYEWDEHPMNVERISEMACFLYESDPGQFTVFVKNYGLTGGSEAACRKRYNVALWSWRAELSWVKVNVSADRMRLFD